MHEFGIARSIADFATSEVEKQRARRVVELEVEVGDLTMVEGPLLSHALRVLMKGPILGDCRVRVRKKPLTLVCRRCSSSLSMKTAMRQMESVPESLLVREPDSKESPTHFLPSLFPAFFHCTRCGSADLELKGGEGVEIRKMKLE